jgi:hypothetical protein
MANLPTRPGAATKTQTTKITKKLEDHEENNNTGDSPKAARFTSIFD